MLAAVFALALITFWLVFVGLARLSGFDISPWAPRLGSLAPERLFDLTRASATTAGVLAGVFAIVYAYRKQKVQEASGRREDSQQLSQRYQDAAEQLGHEKEAVVLAGVYAMSRLADDWIDQRQQCVDVLCAYLRLSTDTDSEGKSRVVQRAIIDEILTHTKVGRDEGKSWSELRLDLSGSRIEDLRAWDNRFANLILKGAQLHGSVHISAGLDGFLNLGGSHVYGSVTLHFSNNGGRVIGWGMHIHRGGSLHASGAAGESEGSPAYSFGSAIVEEGGNLAFTLPPGSVKKTADFYNVTVAGELTVYGTGENCEPGSVRIRDIKTTGSGRLTVQKEIAHASNDVISPSLASLSGVKAETITVGEWTVVDDD